MESLNQAWSVFIKCTCCEYVICGTKYVNSAQVFLEALPYNEAVDGKCLWESCKDKRS